MKGLVTSQLPKLSVSSLLHQNKSNILIQFKCSIPEHSGNDSHWQFSMLFVIFENLESKSSPQATPLIFRDDCQPAQVAFSGVTLFLPGKCCCYIFLSMSYKEKRIFLEQWTWHIPKMNRSSEKKKHYWKLDRIEIARGGESQKPSKVWRSGGGRGGEGRRGEFQKPPWVYMDIFQNNTFCMTEKEDGLPAISATAFCSNFAWTRQRQQKQQEVTYFSTNLSALQLERKSPNAFLTTTT